MSEEQNIDESREDRKTESLKEVNDIPKDVPGKKEQQPTSILKSETKNMETHAHELHKAPGHGWKHYFFEFFMLFLAVFCGFLAENWREHRIEKERGEQYILSFYEDLKTDTANFSKSIAFDDQKVLALGSMFNCYDTVQKNWRATSCMWALVKKSQTNRVFKLTDRTLAQLANAGGYRLLHKEDADSIIGYESQFKAFDDFQSTAFQEAQDNVRNTFSMLVDFNANSQIKATFIGADSSNVDVTMPLLFSNDRALLNKYFNELLLYWRVTKGHRGQMERIRNKAAGLIEFYKSKYHFK